MNTNTYIVLISTLAVITDVNARTVCESIEGHCLTNTSPNKNSTFIHDYIHAEHPYLGTDDVQVYSMSDFIEMNNNEDFNPDDWFMSYMVIA